MCAKWRPVFPLANLNWPFVAQRKGCCIFYDEPCRTQLYTVAAKDACINKHSGQNFTNINDGYKWGSIKIHSRHARYEWEQICDQMAGLACVSHQNTMWHLGGVDFKQNVYIYFNWTVRKGPSVVLPENCLRSNLRYNRWKFPQLWHLLFINLNLRHSRAIYKSEGMLNRMDCGYTVGNLVNEWCCEGNDSQRTEKCIFWGGGARLETSIAQTIGF